MKAAASLIRSTMGERTVRAVLMSVETTRINIGGVGAVCGNFSKAALITCTVLRPDPARPPKSANPHALS